MDDISPIERDFWNAWLQLNPPFQLIREFPADPYSIDFAYPQKKIAIELDGHATHSSPTAIASDRRRQRELERRGWHFIRFGGQEVYQDASACVKETLHFIQGNIEVE